MIPSIYILKINFEKIEDDNTYSSKKRDYHFKSPISFYKKNFFYKKDTPYLLVHDDLSQKKEYVYIYDRKEKKRI